MRLKLDTCALRAATPPSKGYALCWDTELCGFGVRITASGARTFIVEKRVRARKRRVSLGRWPAVTVASARKEARIYLDRVAAGGDPIADKARSVWISITLEHAFRDYTTLKRRSRDGKALKARTRADITRSCNGIFKAWKGRPLVSLTRSMVESRYQEACKRSVVQANIAMKYLRAVFNFTAERSVDAAGRSLVMDNPVNVLRHQWREVPRRKRVMSPEELERWVPAVLQLGEVPVRLSGSGRVRPKLRHGVVFRDLFLFIALTGCRPNEAIDLESTDIDFRSNEVTFRDTKNRLDHTLPLTPYLRELLRRRVEAARSSRVFSSPYDGRPLSNYRAAVRRVREDSRVVFTLQDLRRLAATAMERGRVPVYTLKAVLNHLSGNDVTAGYVQVGRDMKLDALRKIEHFVVTQERGRSAVTVQTWGQSERFGAPVHIQCTWQVDQRPGPVGQPPACGPSVTIAPRRVLIGDSPGQLSRVHRCETPAAGSLGSHFYSHQPTDHVSLGRALLKKRWVRSTLSMFVINSRRLSKLFGTLHPRESVPGRPALQRNSLGRTTEDRHRGSLAQDLCEFQPRCDPP